MAALRFLSSAVEGLAAVYILRQERVAGALRVNAVLGLVGPTILILVTLIGLAGIAEKLSWERIFLIFGAVVLIFVATRG
jgi:uncharacterized membrane protein YeaQ/YmgE (transglycosylase-associated protein family)